MKIVTVVGARPQFIKAAPFSEEFRRENKEILVHTGQHYDSNMSEVFFEELNIPKPDYYLEVGSANHGKQTGQMLEKIEEILLMEKPEALLVYGDTNSTLAGALAASKLHIPVIHVEAGLRSYNKKMPEEQNRILADHISDLLLCPTQTGVSNLAKESITKNVLNTGDIMYDAVLRNLHLAHQYSVETIVQDLEEKQYYLATIHRAENTDVPHKLKTIFTTLEQLDKTVILPIHPRTWKIVHDLGIKTNNVILMEPVSYLPMLQLVSHSYMVITDSGGLQKEAYFLQVPCTTLRDQTEWVETLENGWNILSPIEEDAIIKATRRKLQCLQYPQPQSFGDGHAAKNICQAINRWRRAQ